MQTEIIIIILYTCFTVLASLYMTKTLSCLSTKVHDRKMLASYSENLVEVKGATQTKVAELEE